MWRKVRPAAAAPAQPKEMVSLLMEFVIRHSRDSDETGTACGIRTRVCVGATAEIGRPRPCMREPGTPGARGYLIRKLFLVSLVPFISSRIHTGSMPLPVHFRDLFFLD